MTSACSPKGAVMQCRYLVIEQNSMTIAREKSRNIILTLCKPSRQDVLSVPCFRKCVPVFKMHTCNLYTVLQFNSQATFRLAALWLKTFIPGSNCIFTFIYFFLTLIPEFKVTVSLLEVSFLTQGWYVGI